MTKIVLIGLIVVSMIVGMSYVAVERKSITNASALSVVGTAGTTSFPEIPTAELSTTQQTILSIAERQYATEATSYDDTVLTYTEGFEESWCADFISWIMNEADTPFIHPDTGYWRIPGVQTLKDYYMQYDAYHAVGSYTPEVGDVAFYEGETPDGNSTEHVALVIAVSEDTITTIGGNEGDDETIQVRTEVLKKGVQGLTGFGESGV